MFDLNRRREARNTCSQLLQQMSKNVGVFHHILRRAALNQSHTALYNPGTIHSFFYIMKNSQQFGKNNKKIYAHRKF